MKLLLHLTLIVILFSACDNAHYCDELYADEVLNSFYSPSDIQEIEKLFQFTDKKLQAYTKINDVLAAHRQFWDMQKGAQSSEDLITLIKDTEKFEFFASIDNRIISSFWAIDDELDHVKYKDQWLKNIKGVKHTELNINGKFINYLTEKGDSNIIFKDISHHLVLSGGLPASMYPAFAEKHQDYPISDYEFRMLSTYLILGQDETIDAKLDRHFGVNE